MRDHELVELRRQLAKTVTGRGIYYPDALRERVSAWAYQRRDEGAPWDVIAAELGCQNSTLRRWVQTEDRRVRKRTKPTTALVAVDVDGGGPLVAVEEPVEPTASQPSRRLVCVVSPAGFRVEGLTVDEAVDALRRLS
jgi:phage terminase large subunit GpA-like protein